jgi:hypothetical protein
MLNCRIRYPDAVAGSLIQIKLWQRDTSEVSDEIDGYVGVGVFNSLEPDRYADQVFTDSNKMEPSSFTLAIPVSANVLRSLGDTLLQTEGNPRFHREIHADVAG